MIVYAFISYEAGLIKYFSQKKKAFTGNDVKGFIREISNMFPFQQLVFYGDNASLHHCKTVKEELVNQDHEMLFARPYRPNTNGIEVYWLFANICTGRR